MLFETSLPFIEVVIPGSVTVIDNAAFGRCNSLTAINVSEGNEYYTSVDGVLFNKDITSIIHYPAGKKETNYVIPDGVTEIVTYAFEYCTSLTKIEIPDSVTEIGYGAFSQCTSLTEIVIPDGVTEINGAVFEYCKSLTKIIIPDSVTSIPDYAFSFGMDSSNLTIYGYTGSYAETYAKENGINFVAITETEPDVTEPETTTTTQPETTTTTTTNATTETLISEDENTGVQLLAANGVIAEDVKLNVVVGDAADIDTDAQVYVLNITLVNAQGAVVQPNGTVTISIPIPESFKGSEAYYVYYQAVDGILTDMHATFTNDGYVTFTTNHFSTYIISTVKLMDNSGTDASAGNSNNPYTGVVLTVIPALASAACFVISKKRKQ